jgi:hypothetical protein
MVSYLVKHRDNFTFYLLLLVFHCNLVTISKFKILKTSINIRLLIKVITGI